MADKESVMFRTITEQVDYSTGETVNKEIVTKLKASKEPEFIKLYLQDVLYLQNIPTGLNNILYEMLKLMSYNNLMVINSGVKRMISNTLNCSIHTINKALTHFNRSEILIRQDTGIYLFNPYIFGKGEWKNIESIRATIEWTSEGKHISTTVLRKEDESE